MLTPYAIVRAGSQATEYADAAGRAMRGIDAMGLTLLVGDAIDRAEHAQSFMHSVAAVHEERACIPVRLGEPIRDERAGRRLLETGAERLHRVLDRIESADEWSIVVQPPSTAQLIETEPVQRSGDGRGYLERRRREHDVASGMCAEVSAVLAELCRAFGPHVRDARTLPGTAGGGSLAMLIARETDAAAAFRQFTAGAVLPCTLTGPWPAFSFVGMS